MLIMKKQNLEYKRNLKKWKNKAQVGQKLLFDNI